MKITVHERLCEASGTWSDLFYNILSNELGSVDKTALRAFADQAYRNYAVGSMVDGDDDEISRAVKAASDYLDTHKDGVELRTALKPLEKTLSDTMGAFVSATGIRPNPDVVVGKYYYPEATSRGGVYSEDDDRYATMSLGKPYDSYGDKYELMLKGSLKFGGAMGSTVKYRMSTTATGAAVSTTDPLSSTVYGLDDEIKVSVEYVDPMTRKTVELSHVPTKADLSDVRRVCSLDDGTRKTAKHVYLYRVRTIGVSGEPYIFVVADNVETADRRMKKYVETNSEKVFSSYRHRHEAWRSDRLDGVVLVDGILVYTGYYSRTGTTGYIDLKKGPAYFNDNHPIVFFNENHVNFPNGCEGHVDLEKTDPKKWTMNKGVLMTDAEMEVDRNARKADQDRLHIKSVSVYSFSYRTWIFTVTAVDDAGKTYKFKVWYGEGSGYDTDRSGGFVPSSKLGRELSSLISSGEVKLKDGWVYLADK